MSFRLANTTVHVCNDKDEILRLANLVKNLGSGPAEREEKEGREAWIKAKILAGDLLPFQWAIARTPDDPDGKRVNGQHSSNVFLALTNEEWLQAPWPMTVILQDYHCHHLSLKGEACSWLTRTRGWPAPMRYFRRGTLSRWGSVTVPENLVPCRTINQKHFTQLWVASRNALCFQRARNRFSLLRGALAQDNRTSYIVTYASQMWLRHTGNCPSLGATCFPPRHECRGFSHDPGDTKKDQSILFEQFDDIRSARSKPDKVGAHLAHYPTLVAALKDRNIAVKLSSGLAWYMQKVDGITLHAESPFELIHHNHDIHAFLVFGGSFLRQKFTSHLLHAPLVAAMYHTTRREPSDAQDFWKDVSKGTAHLDAESIQYKLADLCDMYNTHDCKWPAGVSRHIGGHKKPTELDMFGTCLRAFIAWRKGLKIGEVFVPAKGRKADALVQEFYPLPPETLAA